MHKEIRISTCTGSFTRIGTPELVIDSLKEAGFNCYDFTMMYPIIGFELFYNSFDYDLKAKAFRKYADEIGMICNQVHGCVPSIFKGATKEDKERLFNNIKKSIEIARILGAKYCVLHPASDCLMEENIAFFNSLKEIAHQNDVIIAIENMPTSSLFGKAQDLKILLDAIDDDYFKACLDIGHAEIDITGASVSQFFDVLEDKIVCLHVHDNNKARDSHQLPFTQSIDFNEVIKSLKKHNYRGDITFEVSNFFVNMYVPLMKEALRLLYDVGEYIVNELTK